VEDEWFTNSVVGPERQGKVFVWSYPEEGAIPYRFWQLKGSRDGVSVKTMLGRKLGTSSRPLALRFLE
jgi:hypothetical protein